MTDTGREDSIDNVSTAETEFAKLKNPVHPQSFNVESENSNPNTSDYHTPLQNRKQSLDSSEYSVANKIDLSLSSASISGSTTSLNQHTANTTNSINSYKIISCSTVTLLPSSSFHSQSMDSPLMKHRPTESSRRFSLDDSNHDYNMSDNSKPIFISSTVKAESTIPRPIIPPLDDPALRFQHLTSSINNAFKHGRG
ncbi:unnamed protein product [Sphagnum compactum]